MRIVAFSDFRVQDLRKAAEFAASMDPDVILYAGDDIDRFGPLDRGTRARLLAGSKSEQARIQACTSLPREGWNVTPDGRARRSTVWSHLPDTYYFNLRVPGPVTKSGIIGEMSRMLRDGGGDPRRPGTLRMLWMAEQEGIPVESLLGRASVHFRRTPAGAEGTISFRTENHVRRLASAARYGFGAVLGNDDDPVYKALLAGENVFDLHDQPMSVNGFTIIGQEGSSLSDGRGLGHLVYDEGEIKGHLASLQQASEGGPRTILVSHVPPHRVLDHAERFARDHVGSPAVRRFIARHKPLLVFCGHVHSHGGCEARIGPTTVINLASHDVQGSPGRVCVVDISDDLTVATKWFLVLPDEVLGHSTRRLGEGEVMNSVLNIPGIGYRKARELELNDIRTVGDVVAAGAEGLARCGICGAAAQKTVKKAESILNQKAAQLAPLLIPKKPLVFVDIETDLAQSYVWLISVLVEGRRGSFRQFFAETPAGEEGILHDFLSYCGRFSGCVLCCYSGTWFDERVIKRRMATHRLDGSGLGDWFDLYLAIERSVVLPTRSLSLKEIASYFGYKYKHADMDGFGAALEYARSIGKRDESTTKMLLEYGRDDVMVLRRIISRMGRVAGIAPDRSWKPPKCSLPVSFVEECALLKSHREQGLSASEIAQMYGRSKGYVSTRLRETPAETKGKKVAFDSRYASRTGGPPSGTLEPGSGAQPGRGDRTVHGEVVEQVSKNIFRVRVGEATFQVSRKFLRWE